MAGRFMSMKNSNDTIGNRTRDLLACSALSPPQHKLFLHFVTLRLQQPFSAILEVLTAVVLQNQDLQDMTLVLTE
jgi:hypothetical protein